MPHPPGSGTTVTPPASGGSTAPGAPASIAGGRSIREWTTCNGTSDDTAGVTAAFAAAKNAAFPLVVDCPVRLKIGMDISRSIFIDSDTTVIFTGAGKFTVDNVLIPAFVMANSQNIVLTNWNVEYDASLPVDSSAGGYVNNGVFIKGDSPQHAFNDLRLTSWLASNRQINFAKESGVNSQWTGLTNPCAVFYLSGDVAHVTIDGLNMYAPPTAGISRFIPVAFSMNPNYKSGQTLTGPVPMVARYQAIPHDLLFSNITLDGTYMGWVGNARNFTAQSIHSLRYGDLQDAYGGNVGGVGKWFAPPHLFYLSYSSSTDATLVNENISISHVRDEGVRLGVARDKGGSDSISGYANSLKISCKACAVDGYTSSRPDGFMDVLSAEGLSVSNVTATYDSSFINNLYPGWRFPSSSYNDVKFENISLTDLAPVTSAMPVGNATQSNHNVIFSNVRIGMHRWGGDGSPLPAVALPAIHGEDSSVSLNYAINDTHEQIVHFQTAYVQTTLHATPAKVNAGSATTLIYSSRQAGDCSPSGAWAGTTGTNGMRTVKMSAPGSFNFNLTCVNGGNSASAAVQVAVLP